MSSLQSRKDEIAAKRTKLAELKRQRELRASAAAGRALAMPLRYAVISIL